MKVPFKFKHQNGEWFFKANVGGKALKRVEKDQPSYLPIHGIETFAKKQMSHLLEKAGKEIESHLLS